MHHPHEFRQGLGGRVQVHTRCDANLLALVTHCFCLQCHRHVALGVDVLRGCADASGEQFLCEPALFSSELASVPKSAAAAPNATSRNSQYPLAHTCWYLRPSLSGTASKHKRTCSKAPLLPLYSHLQFRRMKGPRSPA